VNGWVTDELGRIPNVGDQFRFHHLIVQVLSADAKKVLEVMIEVIPVDDEETDD
jgi:CBS domain containing-hemolysin-like protein